MGILRMKFVIKSPLYPQAIFLLSSVLKGPIDQTDDLFPIFLTQARTVLHKRWIPSVLRFAHLISHGISQQPSIQYFLVVKKKVALTSLIARITALSSKKHLSWC